MGRALLCLLIVGAGWTTAAVQKPATRTMVFQGNKRPFQLLVPAQAAAGPVPLVVLLHGSGRDGVSQMRVWQDLGRDEGVAVAAPDSFDPRGWSLDTEGPDYFQALVEAVKKDVRVDDRRVYLFGHSAGGHQALGIGLLESEYFAAIAVHAGGLNPSQKIFVQQARRKIPVAMWHGTADRVVPADFARSTRDMLKGMDIPVQLTEIANHTHDYYSRAKRINEEAWAFLKQHALATDPLFRQYVFGK